MRGLDNVYPSDQCTASYQLSSTRVSQTIERAPRYEAYAFSDVPARVTFSRGIRASTWKNSKASGRA